MARRLRCRAAQGPGRLALALDARHEPLLPSRASAPGRSLIGPSRPPAAPCLAGAGARAAQGAERLRDQGGLHGRGDPGAAGEAAGDVRPGRYPTARPGQGTGDAPPALAGAEAGTGDPGSQGLLAAHLAGSEEGIEGPLPETRLAG